MIITTTNLNSANLANFEFVQKGMQSEGYEGLWIGDQELRIRHFHDTLEKYLDPDATAIFEKSSSSGKKTSSKSAKK